MDAVSCHALSPLFGHEGDDIMVFFFFGCFLSLGFVSCEGFFLERGRRSFWRGRRGGFVITVCRGSGNLDDMRF